MAYYRRRLFRRLRQGYRPSRRSRIRSRSRRSIRKDLDKIGYPTHVKFIGFTQRKTFLLKTESTTADIGSTESILYYLDPRESPKWVKYIGEKDNIKYQTFSVKKIYVRITPIANTFTTTAQIPQLKMTYHYYIPGNSTINADSALKTQSEYKDEYVFDSNKSITFVIKRPRPCTGITIDKPRTDVLLSYLGNYDAIGDEKDDGYYNDDEDVEKIQNTDFNYGILRIEGAEHTAYNIQVTYKVSVRN